MLRFVRAVGAWVFGLTLAPLITFWAVKGTEPSGHVALWVLYGAFGSSAVIWVVATLLLRRRDAQSDGPARQAPRPSLDHTEEQLEIKRGQQEAERAHHVERPALPLGQHRATTTQKADLTRLLQGGERTLSGMPFVLFPDDPDREGKLIGYRRLIEGWTGEVCALLGQIVAPLATEFMGTGSAYVAVVKTGDDWADLRNMLDGRVRRLRAIVAMVR